MHSKSRLESQKPLILLLAMERTEKIIAGRELETIQAVVYPLYFEEDMT